MILPNRTGPQLVGVLNSGGVAVILSDTIYGIMARADNPPAIQRVRALKDRNDQQAMIVLCANKDQVKRFGGIDDDYLAYADNYWPGKVSIIFKPSKHYPDIQGDPDELSFRVPDDAELVALLEQTGPLVAPSANPRGLEPAHTIDGAVSYFGDQVDVYADSGRAKNLKSSKVIKINPDGSEEVFRA